MKFLILLSFLFSAVSFGQGIKVPNTFDGDKAILGNLDVNSAAGGILTIGTNVSSEGRINMGDIDVGTTTGARIEFFGMQNATSAAPNESGIVFRSSSASNFSSMTGYRGSSSGRVGVSFFIDNGGVPFEGFRFDDGGVGRNTTGTWTSISDARLKKNVTPIESSIEKLKLLNPVHYEWINTPIEKREGLQTGFIAQEVEQVFPKMVDEAPAMFVEDKELTGTNAKYLALNLEPYLVKAIQELSKRVEELEAKLNDKQ